MAWNTTKGKKAGRRKGGSQSVIREGEMLNLMRRGWTQAAIAEKLGVHPSQIGYDWKNVLQRLLKQQTEDTRALVSIKLEEYAEIKREAWAQWELSKRESVKQKVRRRGYAEEGREETTEVAQGRGDAKYLRIICDCLHAERELKGLDKPKEMKVSGTLTWDVLSGVLQQGATEDDVDLIEGEIVRALEDRVLEKEVIDTEARVVTQHEKKDKKGK